MHDMQESYWEKNSERNMELQRERIKRKNKLLKRHKKQDLYIR